MTATILFNSRSCARKTVPLPPCPSCSNSSYRNLRRGHPRCILPDGIGGRIDPTGFAELVSGFMAARSVLIQSGLSHVRRSGSVIIHFGNSCLSSGRNTPHSLVCTGLCGNALFRTWTAPKRTKRTSALNRISLNKVANAIIFLALFSSGEGRNKRKALTITRDRADSILRKTGL